MHFSECLMALAALSSLAAAAPGAKTGFTMHQHSVGKKFKNGAVERVKTLRKYQAHVPASLAKAAAAALQSGTVVATPEQYDESYLCPVTIGTPGVTLNMDFDSGSSDFWAFCSNTPSSERSGHLYYTPASSSTEKLLSGYTWDISYGDGSGARGNVYSDKVVIASVTATSQAVECATSVSSEFTEDTKNDGLVGFAFDSLNTVEPKAQQTWFGNVLPTLPLPVFCAWLKHDAAGAYDIGFLNSSHYTGTVTYTNVNSANGFWEFTATGYSVGTTSYTLSLDSIADTGTTLIYVPDSVLKNYYAKVSGASNSEEYGGYVFPCTATLPNFSVTIGGSSRTVPGSYLNYAPVTTGSKTCFGGLQSSDGIGFNILGDMFLKSQYAVFDISVPRIGFATQL